MKRPNNSQYAQRDSLGALSVLRQLTKEAGGNCLAILQADVTSIEQSVRSAGRWLFTDRRRPAACSPSWAYQAADQTLSIMSNRPLVRTTRNLPHEMGPLQ